jgi:Protein of Unknown function (DUF2784)
MIAPVAADAILALHLAIIAFNVFGLVAIPLGAWRGRRFVRAAWWRLLHVAALGAVAAQALCGRACFLTLWQSALSGYDGRPQPLVMRWVGAIVFWRLPQWFFAVLYTLVFVYVLILLWLVPPSWRKPSR